jgi:hypothetical protein
MPSNSLRKRCAFRQMTANPSSSCTCASLRLERIQRRAVTLELERFSSTRLIASGYSFDDLRRRIRQCGDSCGITASSMGCLMRL